MKCRHKTAVFYRWSLDRWTAFATAPSGVAFSRDRATCATCGEWLSLGPANDDDERVKVGIAAARLALDGIDLSLAAFEAYGANLFHNEPHDSVPANEREWAGYLASVIAAHEEPNA